MNKKIYMLFVMVLGFCVIRADEHTVNFIEDPKDPEQQHDKAIDSLDDLGEFDEFDEFERMMYDIDEDSFTHIDPLPWWKQTIINTGATIYLKYRACRKWLDSFFVSSEAVR